MKRRNHGQRQNFNPRSPCGERQFVKIVQLHRGQFQSTLPVWGATAAAATFVFFIQRFQSTLPVWGATFAIGNGDSDVLHFNPRSPCGERPDLDALEGFYGYFNPRSPCGERLD